MTNKALPYMAPYRDKDFPRLLMANRVTNPKCKGMGVGAPAARRPRCSSGLPPARVAHASRLCLHGVQDHQMTRSLRSITDSNRQSTYLQHPSMEAHLQNPH